MLYWYRTPPGVRMGRQPFDPDVQKLIEAQNPGVSFDWNTIINTPMPPPDMTEYWRERRRQEKAAKQERRAAEAAEAAEAVGEAGENVAAEAAEVPVGAEGAVAVAGDAAEGDSGSGMADAAVVDLTAERGGDAPAQAAGDGASVTRKRRRRRGGRRRKPDGTAQAAGETLGSGEGEPDDSGPSDGDDPASEGE